LDQQLTPRDQGVLAAIGALCAEHGRDVGLSEIRWRLGFYSDSDPVLAAAIHSLLAAGLIAVGALEPGRYAPKYRVREAGVECRSSSAALVSST